MKFEITKQVLASIVRWALAYVGIYLVKRGVIDPALADAWLNEITFVVVGVVVLGVTFLWKYLNARYNVLSLILAVQTEPPADTPKEITQAVKDVKAEVKITDTVITY